MSTFEPQSDAIGQSDERLDRLQNGYTDEELLLELRRRGRLARVEAEAIVDQRYVEDGYTIEQQIDRAWRYAANEAARLHVAGIKPTGAVVDNVMGDGVHRWLRDPSRRVRFAVNYVVDQR